MMSERTHAGMRFGTTSEQTRIAKVAVERRERYEKTRPIGGTRQTPSIPVAPRYPSTPLVKQTTSGMRKASEYLCDSWPYSPSDFLDPGFPLFPEGWMRE